VYSTILPGARSTLRPSKANWFRSVVTSLPVQGKVWSVSFPSAVNDSWWCVELGERSSSPSVTKAPSGTSVPTPAKSALTPTTQCTRAHMRLVVSRRGPSSATRSLDSTARSDTGAPAVMWATFTSMGGLLRFRTRCSTPSAGVFRAVIV
jgi:hypothetical protein